MVIAMRKGKRQAMRRRVLSYLRVAPGRDDAEAVLATQRDLIAAAAAAEDWTVAEEYVDTAWSSVPLAERIAGKRLLADLQPGDVVIATALDRVFGELDETVKLFETFRGRQVELYLLDLGRHQDDSEMVERLLKAFAGRP
jgi:DNA invertase Pin-like site-specific DNA recombinase